MSVIASIVNTYQERKATCLILSSFIRVVLMRK